jgi:branched-chain amino acid transport system ATP-binding protein
VGALLELVDVSLSFKGIRALTDVSFAVEQGSICALIGPNGAGKSSLLNVINGVYRADHGDIVFDRRRATVMHPLSAARAGIGRTFQHSALFKNLSVLDNVLTGMSRHARSTFVENIFRVGRYSSEDRAFRRKSERILEFLELSPFRDTVVGKLPYGIQKRVDLARALVGDPRLLLFDEPMAGMNHGEKADMSRFILAANRELKATVVLIEHDIGVVMGLSHHVVVLDHGRKVGDGTPDEVRRIPEVITAYLGPIH